MRTTTYTCDGGGCGKTAPGSQGLVDGDRHYTPDGWTKLYVERRTKNGVHFLCPDCNARLVDALAPLLTRPATSDPLAPRPEK